VCPGFDSPFANQHIAEFRLTIFDPQEVEDAQSTRFFDRPLRAVKEYHEKVDYIHLNPVKTGLVCRPEDWPWSSIHDYESGVRQAPSCPSGLAIDRFLLPADEQTGT
jgi:hypothetical protein